MFIVNDTGLGLTITVVDDALQAINISAATSTFFQFEKPNSNAILQKVAIFVTDGTDGRLRYVLESGFLNTVGQWQVRARVVEASKDFRTEKLKITVDP